MKQSRYASLFSDINEVFSLLSSSNNRLFQVPVRQVAGTVLKNTFFAKDPAEFARQMEHYRSLPEAIRQAVKTCTLQSILSPQRDVRAAAASAACHVAIAEMSINPNGWEEFFTGLVQLAQQTQTEESCGRAESALKCIGATSSSQFNVFLMHISLHPGYFAERAEELSLKVDAPKTNMILTSVVGSLVGQPESVRLAALSAINHILPFARMNFNTEAERNFIIQRLHDCALPACAPDGAAAAYPNSPSIREAALECCTRVIELYYEKVDPGYVVAIYNITTAVLDLKTNTPEEVMLQAINFWSTLARVETHYQEAMEAGDDTVVSKKLAVLAAGTVLPQLLACILGEGRDYRETDPDSEDDSHNPYTAAAECLGYFAGLMKNDILAIVFPFFDNLKSRDWKAREAALFAFAQIMEGPQENVSDPSKDITALIAQLLPSGVIPLLLDESSQAVRHSAAFALGRAVKCFPQAVLRVYSKPDNFYLSMVQMLEPGRPSAKDPRTVEFFLWSLKSMVESVSETSQNQHILPGTEVIFEALLVTADRPDSSQSELRSVSFEVLCDFIFSCSDAMLPHIMHSLMPNILNRLCIALSAPQSSQVDANTRNVVVSKLISCVGSIFSRFSQNPQATAELATLIKSMMPNGLSWADNTVTFFLQALPADADIGSSSMCAEEVVLACAQMSKIVTVDFGRYLPGLHPRLLTFMQNISVGDLAYITCTSIGDIVRSIGQPLLSTPQALLEWIYYSGLIIANPGSDANFGVTTYNSVRSIAVNLISDIVIEIGASINDQYREQILIALGYAHAEIRKLVSRLPVGLEENDNEYLKTILSDTLGLWMALSQAHKASGDAQPGSGQVFVQFIPQVLECISFADGFTQWLGLDEDRGDPAPLLCSCADLVTDSARCLGPAVAAQLRATPVVAEVLQRLGRVQDAKSQETFKCVFFTPPPPPWSLCAHNVHSGFASLFSTARANRLVCLGFP
jgi:hypothetical protein